MTYETTCETARERIDAFIDGDMDEAGSAALREHCVRCPACAREFALARRVRDGLRALPALKAPARVIRGAAGAASHATVVPLPARPRRLHARPLLAGMVAAALVVATAAVWISGSRRHAPATGYTEAEVRRAQQEMALAFSYVDRYSTESTEHVMEKRVVPRIERALAASGEAAVHDALVPGLRRAVRGFKPDVTSPPSTRS